MTRFLFVAILLLATVAAAIAEESIVLRGRALLPDGKPADGAHVAAIGKRTAVVRGSDYAGWGPEVLAEATAGEKGEYVLRLRGVSQQSHASPRVIARKDGSAIAWRELKFDAAETHVDLDLKPEVPLRVKLVDVEGQPAAGVRISVEWVVERAENEEYKQYEHGVSYSASDRVPVAWIAPTTSDMHGRIVVHGVAADQGVMLDVHGDDRFARQDIALNTGMSEERSGSNGSYRPLVKNLQPGEEVVLALSPAQVFEGTVRYADSGEPAPHARLSITARQQENGSMMSVDGSADEQGQYRITPRPGIGFGLTAHPPAGTPYLARRSKDISWKGGERVKKIDVTLPRGVLVRGTVVEHATGARVAGASVQYHPESANNRNRSNDIVTGWQCVEVTDKVGRFAIAVLPGPGRLLVNGPQGKYVLREIGERELGLGKPGGRRHYVHAFARLDPEAGQDEVEVKLEIEPGVMASGRIVDEAGNAIDEVLVISRLNIWPVSPFWRGQTTPTRGGRFELTGLAEGVDYPIYFLDAKRRIGTTGIIKAGDQERTVVLKPCGKATLRLVNGKGEPVPANYGLPEMVVTPGPYHYDRDALERGELTADADYVSNIDRLNNPFPPHEDENGTRTLQALIPGATYRVVGKRDDQLKIVKEFQVKSNETVDLGDIVVER